jgi:hypothetical protein
MHLYSIFHSSGLTAACSTADTATAAATVGGIIGQWQGFPGAARYNLVPLVKTAKRTFELPDLLLGPLERRRWWHCDR